MIYVLTVLVYNLDHEVICPLGIEVVYTDGCQLKPMLIIAPLNWYSLQNVD
jgi:hypothetical protein